MAGRRFPGHDNIPGGMRCYSHARSNRVASRGRDGQGSVMIEAER